MVIFAWLIASAYGDTCAKYFTYIGGNEGILTIPPFQSYEHQLSVIVSYSGQLFSVCIIKMQIFAYLILFTYNKFIEICRRFGFRKRFKGNDQQFSKRNTTEIQNSRAGDKAISNHI